MNRDLLARIGVVVAIVIAIIACFLPVRQAIEQAAGGITTGTAFSHGISVGAQSLSPTNVAFYQSGTCFLIANASIAATSTANIDCAITGVKPGDIVRLTLAASTTLASQYEIKSAQASSTAGFATIQLVNLTGGAATPAATNGFGSSTVYQIWRSQ